MSRKTDLKPFRKGTQAGFKIFEGSHEVGSFIFTSDLEFDKFVLEMNAIFKEKHSQLNWHPELRTVCDAALENVRT